MSQSRRILTYLFAVAMVIAPFLALLYDLTAGLAVLAAALAATTYVAYDVARQVAPARRGRLLVLVGVNGGLALLATGLLAARLTGAL